MISYYQDMPACEDRLNFGRVVHQLLRDLRNGSLTPPLTVGVQGHWGQGKSSVLAMVEAQAAGDMVIQSKCLFHTFSPWRYQKEKHLLIPLLLELAKEHPKLEIMESVRRVCHALVHLAGDVILAASTLKTLNMEKVGKALDIYKPASKIGLPQAQQALSDFIQCRDTLLDVFQKITNGGKKTLVILVDDLDRCHPPEVAVELLEQIHLFFAQEEKMPVIFILAIDPQALRDILSRRFDADKAQLYLEKFIQLPIHLPRAVPSLMAHRIGLEELKKHPFYAPLASDPAVANMLERLALHVYPTARQMKRFLNQVLFMNCTRCGNASNGRCDSLGCHGSKAKSATLLSLIRWLVYKDNAPELADDPVLLLGVEKELKGGDEHMAEAEADDQVVIRQAELVKFLTPHVGAGKADGVASFLLATRDHAITDLQTIHRFIYSTPEPGGGENYRHYGMRESIERAYREGRLQGDLGRLEKLDLHHLCIPGGTLSNTIFEGCTFSHGNLSGVDLTDTAFAQCTFAHVPLAGARVKAESETTLILSGCTFREVVLDNMQFKGVEFQRCVFDKCTIKQMKLDAVEFTGCSFKECLINADGIFLEGSDTAKRQTLLSLLQAMKHNRDNKIAAGKPSFDDVIELLKQQYGGLLLQR